MSTAPVSPAGARPMSGAGRMFAFAALLEGLTWAGLLLGMLLKYGTQTTGIPPSDLGVWLFGRLHGGAFLFYLAATLLAAVRMRWPWWAWALALLAAVPPLLTVPAEMLLRRQGLLSR